MSPAARTSTPPADGRLGLALLLALTFSTGIVDAVGIIGLDGVFTGNMTGNVVLIGMSLVSQTTQPTLGLGVALTGFVLGAVVGGRVLRRAATGWSAPVCWILGTTAVLLAACAGSLLAVQGPGTGLITAITGVLAMAMGLQAAAARHVGVKDLSTVVVTSTLTGLAADSRLGRQDGQLWFRRVTAIGMIGLGALVGAGLTLLHLAAGIGLSLVVTITVVWVAALRLIPRPGDGPASMTGAGAATASAEFPEGEAAQTAETLALPVPEGIR
ncbi:YoaK family protein [Citricoccus sp. K5]|uniref:YoaK family protein n=1 Tax=Citricoccus sp. K5 TaxID=2653135 RepID=UPI0012EFE2EF|nr:YoaK family protein [Citricoccus sp. K5]VXB86595.1 conserved membrane hypothetical protein [Citricoccus sp. K5]